QGGMVKDIPYWIDTAPAFPDRSSQPLPGMVDVAIVGGGLTGLHAAIRLGRTGATGVVVGRGRFCSGASGRNRGLRTTALAVATEAAIRRYGLATARAYHAAYQEAVDFVETFVRTEGIDCGFRRAGRLGVACTPSHHERQKSTQKLLA